MSDNIEKKVKVEEYFDEKRATLKIEITESTKYLRKGQIIEPAKWLAEKLIKEKKAKEVK